MTPGPWRTALTAWAASRVLVLVLGVAAWALLGVPERGVDPAVPHALSYLGGWDTTWYLDVARDGYDAASGLVGTEFTDLAFYPLLPLVMAGALAAGLNPFIVALLVVHAAFLLALRGVHALTAARIGAAHARTATWAVALAPPAIAASQAYTEAVTLALAVGAAVAATRGRHLAGGVAAGLATLARPTGALVALLVLMLGWGPREGRLRRAAAAVLPSVVALGGFLAWMQWRRGSWRLPFDAQQAWDRGGVVTGLVTDLPREVEAAWRAVSGLDVTTAWAAGARDLLFAGLYAVLLAALWRREGGLRSPWVTYCALALALPLSSGTTASLARFGVIAFPLAWPLAERLDTPRRRALAAAAAVVVTAALMVLTRYRSP